MFYETIIDSDINCENNLLSSENKKLRLAARGIVVSNQDKNKIAIFYKENMNEYKLPGGGIEGNELPTEAFKREVLEEVGCEVTDIMPIGITTEIKSKSNFVQTSFVFKATQLDEQRENALTESEKIEGGKMLWLDIDEAINRIENSYDKLKSGVYETVYATTFIVKRDELILKQYRKMLKEK